MSKMNSRVGSRMGYSKAPNASSTKGASTDGGGLPRLKFEESMGMFEDDEISNLSGLNPNLTKSDKANKGSSKFTSGKNSSL